MRKKGPSMLICGISCVHKYSDLPVHFAFTTLNLNPRTGTDIESQETPRLFGHVRVQERALKVGSLGTLMEMVHVERCEGGKLLVVAVGLSRLRAEALTQTLPFKVRALADQRGYE